MNPKLVAELQAKGYGGDDISLLEIPDGEHNQATWGRVLPDFLEWAFPAND